MMSFLAFLTLIIVSTAEMSRIVSNDTTLRSIYPDIHDKYKQLFYATNRSLYGHDFPLRPMTPTITQLMIAAWVIGNYL